MLKITVLNKHELSLFSLEMDVGNGEDIYVVGPKDPICKFDGVDNYCFRHIRDLPLWKFLSYMYSPDFELIKLKSDNDQDKFYDDYLNAINKEENNGRQDQQGDIRVENGDQGAA